MSIQNCREFLLFIYMPLVTDAKKVSLTKPKLSREAKFVNVNYKECEKWIGVYFALVFCRLEVKS